MIDDSSSKKKNCYITEAMSKMSLRGFKNIVIFSLFSNIF